MKTNKKQGVSLMVLILTIIVMVILAGTIIISLNNAGVINRAQGAVSEYNLKQVEELANVAWGEAFVAGNRTQKDLEQYILEELTTNGVDLNTYKVEVTTDGVIVRLKTEEEKFFLAWGATNGVWTEYNSTQTPQGDIIAKLYKTGNKVSIRIDYDKDGQELAEPIQKEVDEYRLVISGTGKIPDVIGYAWQEGIYDWGVGLGWLGDTYARSIAELVIEDGITNIPDFAFTGADNIKNIYISETTKEIGMMTFYNCGISVVKIPSTVENIGYHAFANSTIDKIKIYSTDFEIDVQPFDGARNIYVLNNDVKELLEGEYYNSPVTITLVSSVEEMEAI